MEPDLKREPFLKRGDVMTLHNITAHEYYFVSNLAFFHSPQKCSRNYHTVSMATTHQGPLAASFSHGKLWLMMMSCSQTAT